ncbi:MAG TPA: winged helix-turn-helix transcriptional regulator [Candidatus Scatomorpha pullicola]|nr:winged helix-turn-helix transcriptional regulator [Candidatus Scatomorpha pullicola]
MSYAALPHDHGGDVEHVVEHMPKTESFQIVSDIFKLMDDNSRIRIFWLLCHCEECVINISALVDMSSPAVSHHLRQLKNGGLITSRREGKEVYYKAADTAQARLLHHVIEELVEITCPDCAEEHR